ncbi:hypothetical protein BKA04_001158 [Cryobacterium mesophilum]|uniref:Uncharacterized protein n=1 Tax=Terrimesophilobacter mesophilus TaxID=433647 RepID=A0A4R8VD01_9MICO|nr:hypothetical protein [Terrimesophilobacter mesophilus]MBB5632935.1 hypothetical protein [Terrimesophilobacter mesophilus]TFB79707.1 hypothetical protein E3N84_06420 [Terrimesophilobacter mesophilus]
MNAQVATPDENAREDAASPEETPETVDVVETPADAVEPAGTGEVTPATEATADMSGDRSSTGEVAAAPVQTVYVTAPTPPRPKGNRGMGTMLAVVAAIVFAAVYAGVVAALILIMSPDQFSGAIGQFISGPQFYVPALVFLVLMVLWALLANRASWWSWVIGSFVIAVLTYFVSIGIWILLQGGFGLTGSEAAAAFVASAINPALIAAALVARECAIWFGAAIAKRGRRVRERNYEAWQQFERDEAQKRADLGGVAAA